MSHNFDQNQHKSQEWLTPKYIIGALGRFDLDPCSPINRPWNTATRHFTKDDDGLLMDWEGRVWLNPPYGTETKKWVKKLAAHGDGIALIFARTDTSMFQDIIFPNMSGILFLKERLRFCKTDGTVYTNNAGAPSVLVAFGKENSRSLRDCGLKGYYHGVD